MKFIFEILLLGIIAGGAYAGVKFGFINIAAKPIKAVASFMFAFSLSSPVGKGVIAPIIQAPVTNYIKDFMYDNCKNLSPDNVVRELPTILKMAGGAAGVDMTVTVGQSTDQVVGTLIHKLTNPFVNIVAIIISFVLLFFVAKLLISLGIYLVNRFCDAGALAIVNKSMGFVLAGFLAILAAWAFVSVMEFFFHLPIFDKSEVVQSFNGGLLYRLFNSISPLELLLSF